MLNHKNTKIMETTIMKIEKLFVERKQDELKNAKLLWVDNYKINGNFELPIAIFITNDTQNYLFVTGVQVYSLKREYKQITDFETIAKALWMRYIK